MNYTNITQLPKGGELVSLTCGGKFAGCCKNKSQPVKIVSQLNLNEKFIVEFQNNLYAFRQQVSNNYIGGYTADGTKAVFVPAKKSAEQFTLEPIFNGNVRVRSNKNTYLCMVGDSLTWKTIPDSAEECLWKVTPLDNNNAWGQQQQKFH